MNNEMLFITVHNKPWGETGGYYFVFDEHPHNGTLIPGPYGDHNSHVGYWQKGGTNMMLQNHTRISGKAFKGRFPLPDCIKKFLDFQLVP